MSIMIQITEAPNIINQSC